MKDQARGSSTSLGVKSFNAAEIAAAKEEFVKQKGTFKDYSLEDISDALRKGLSENFKKR